MLLYTHHTYTNTRKDGKVFYHEEKDRAIMAVDLGGGNRDEYESIAVHSKFDVRRCDPCAAENTYNPGNLTRNGKDLCKKHYDLAVKQYFFIMLVHHVFTLLNHPMTVGSRIL